MPKDADQYSDHNLEAAERLYRAVPALKLGAWEIEKKAILRSEKRLDRMALDVQAREIKHMILVDLAKDLPTFDEWVSQRASS